MRDIYRDDEHLSKAIWLDDLLERQISQHSHRHINNRITAAARVDCVCFDRIVRAIKTNRLNERGGGFGERTHQSQHFPIIIGEFEPAR